MTQTPAPPPGEEPTTRRQRGRSPSQFLEGRGCPRPGSAPTIADGSRALGTNDETLGN